MKNNTKSKNVAVKKIILRLDTISDHSIRCEKNMYDKEYEFKSVIERILELYLFVNF